jgi:ribosomal-protein-alanine N-acetyltransferase
VSVELRRATLADLDVVLSLEENAFETDRFNRRQLAYLLRAARAETWLALLRQTPVAYGMLLLPALPRPARLYTLCVARAARRQGVARMLCERLVLRARHRGYRRLRLEVSERNAGAERLYRSLGFSRLCPLAPGYYGDGSGGWRMELTLAD